MKKTVRLLIICLMAAVAPRAVVARPPVDTPPGKPAVVFVKGGTFQMGSEDGNRDEAPLHSVTLSDFSMGIYPVTVKQYKKFCEATSRKMPKAPKWGWHDDYPMVNITYKDAQNYCKWLCEQYGGRWRLPTEAEWEYAARGGHTGQNTAYSGGNDIEAVGWYSENSAKQTHPVGRKQPNALGLYDLSGNVSEWCSDWYGEKYYAESPEANPPGIAYEQAIIPGTFFARCRVVRGGSWRQDAAAARVTARSYYLPRRKWHHIGFRVVLQSQE